MAGAEPADPTPLPPAPPAGINPELPEEATPADLDAVQESWETELAATLALWVGIAAAWRVSLGRQVEQHVAASDIVSLANLHVDSRDGAAIIEDAMRRLAADAAGQVVAEAAAQDVMIHAALTDPLWTASVAQVWADVLGESMASSATGEALRVWPAKHGGQAEGERVAELVTTHLEGLTDAQPRKVIGGTLTAAQHQGRISTMLAGPDAALYSDEVLDKNTCAPCKAINRKWLGNASTDAEQVLSLYPVQGYVACLGGVRCRGQVCAVWRGGTDWTKWVELPEQRRG